MINTVCVCGAGTMGSGIAQLVAGRGIPTIVYDLDPRVLTKSKAYISNQLEQLVNKNKINTQDYQNYLASLRFTTDINECKADLVIEAIVEAPGPKIALFNQLAEINPPETIFTSNTSSLSITAIANAVQQPERLAGLHFFNPAPVMKLVELVTTAFTAESVIMRLSKFIKAIGKNGVSCKDAPGFIVNRVARPFYLESLYLAEQYGIRISDIDQLVKAIGFKMGPFELMDLIGNDINYTVSASIYQAMNSPARLEPSDFQLKKVEAGELGIKTGKGFYEYPGTPADSK